MLVELKSIKTRVGRIKGENLTIYDAFLDRNDTLLLLVDYSNDLTETFFWVSSNQIISTKIENYIEQLKQFQLDQVSSCNSSKMYTLPCVKKTRTVGLFLSVYNCGIISGYREIFGYETTAQVVAFLLYLIDNSKQWTKVNILY